MDKNKIINDAGILENAVDEAQTWIKNNESLVESHGKKVESELAKLRKQKRQLRSLKKAAARKMCVGVFGPSQAGKSYLLSSLARDPENKLFCDFLGEKKDFVSELDPGGGRESTGLVTRFTITQPTNIPGGFPVHVRMLSETELVKIFANTYFCDAVHKEMPDKDKIKAYLDPLKSRTGSECPHLKIDDMEELREYVTKSFGDKGRAVALEEVYWNDAVKIGPRLSLADRIALYSIIWDGIEEFSNLLRELLQELEKIDFPEEAYCRIQAVCPREQSILDVETLGKKTLPPVEVRGNSGKTALIKRDALTAIVAELTLVMMYKPAEFFDHTDLLDFPGYKARLECTDIREYLHGGKSDSAPEQFFRRGKVAYLFQRYTAERELTSLLLCVSEPTNVPGLPAAIEEWIISTHGKLPEDRQRVNNTSLLYILTKSDRYFEEKAGIDASLWENSIKGAFLGHFSGAFSQSTGWVEQWKPKTPFKNLFLLRNVNVKWDKIYNFEGVKESTVKQDKTEFVEKMKQWFLQSASAKKHFESPEAAFSALMAPNDGGMERIKETLKPLCVPDLKLNQIENQLNMLVVALRSSLQIFWVSGDKDDELKKKTAMFNQLGKLFVNPKFKEHFPELLSALTISSDKLFYLYDEARRRCEEYKEKAYAVPDNASTESQNATEDDFMSDPLNLDDMFNEPVQTQTSDQNAIASDDKDENYFYAESIILNWGETLHNFAKLASIRSYYAFPSQPDLFTFLLDEMDSAIVRMGLQKELENKFRELGKFTDVKRDKIVRKQANYALGKLNEFVCWLGKAEERTITYNKNDVKIFAPRPEVVDYPELPENFQPFAGNWYKEWLLAFYGMIVDNVSSSDGQAINLEQNLILGKILEQIKKVGA